MAGFTQWLSRKAGLTQHEARGALVLLCAVCLTVFVPMALSAYYRQQAQAGHALLLARMDSLLRARPESANAAAVAYSLKSEAAVVYGTAKVDPNHATAEEMEAIGMPAFLATRITHYVAAGGRFRKAEELRKIYGFKEAVFQRVRPNIRIAAVAKEPRQHIAQNIRPLDVNEADSTALEALPGIGDFTARSIVKYRNLLGGYVSLDQLYELYHQDSARTKMFRKYLFIKVGYEPRKLRINTAGQERLYHPYLSKPSVRLISAYVKQNGYLSTWEDLRAKKLVSEEELDKLRPYLSFD